jgi:hypothetical protein
MIPSTYHLKHVKKSAQRIRLADQIDTLQDRLSELRSAEARYAFGQSEAPVGSRPVRLIDWQ